MAKPKTFIPAKRCHSHIGGQLGTLLMEHFITVKWVEPVEGNERLFAITTKGKKGFAEMGVDVSLIAEQEMEA